MAYLGNSPVLSQQEYRNIDDISGSFNGVTTSFALLVNGVAPIPGPQTSNQCLISVNGVIQKPDDTGASGFRISGGNIVFSSAPTGGQTFFGVILAGADYIYAGENFPDGTVSAPTITFAQDLDTGFYRSGAGEVKFTANGVNTVTFSSNGLTAPNFIPSGSSVPTNGVYLPSANNVAIATNSTQRLLIDSSGQIEAVSLGSAAAPTWSFTTDTNTGIYSPGADQVAISTGGSGRLFVDASGRVGVGVSSPQSLFHVDGDATAIRVTRGSAIGFAYNTGTAATDSFRIQSNGGSVDLLSAASQPITLSAGGSEKVRITSAGLVGVGTSSPSSLLHLSSDLPILTFTDVNDTASSRVYQDDNLFVIDVDNANAKASSVLAFRVDNTERARIDSSGRLGIGTTSPQQLLHVDSGSGGANAAITLRTTGYSGNQFNFYAQVTPEVISVIESTERAIAFKANGSERARIDSSGRWLLGTSTDRFSTKLLVEGTDGSSGATFARNSNDGGPAYSLFIKSRGTTVGSNTVVQSGDTLGFIGFYGTDGTSPISGASIQAQVDGTPGTNDMPGRLVFSTTADGAASPSTRLTINNSGQVILSQGAAKAAVTSYSGEGVYIHHYEASSGLASASERTLDISAAGDGTKGGNIRFFTNPNGTAGTTERMRITNIGDLTNKTSNIGSITGTGFTLGASGYFVVTRSADCPVFINRETNDGNLIEFRQDGTTEGNINVSGTTVALAGAHLSRWSQLPSGVERTEILRGSVLSNIDEMCEWGDEENEQLNRMKVSDVEGDKNVSGVFQAWDDDDDTYVNDFYCAMTGDFIIRIAQGVTVERGDLLMSAGDGTAKPQDDDIIRSKTIAKVTSTNVSCTYDDGSYCVPCVLMAC